MTAVLTVCEGVFATKDQRLAVLQERWGNGTITLDERVELAQLDQWMRFYGDHTARTGRCECWPGRKAQGVAA